MAVPFVGARVMVTVVGSRTPLVEISLARTLMVTGMPLVVVAESLTAMGGGFVPRTDTIVVAVLLVGLGSASKAISVTLFVSERAAVGVIVTATVAAPPKGRSPMSQRTTPYACVTVPWLAPAATKLAYCGSVSTSVTAIAFDGPRFTIPIV